MLLNKDNAGLLALGKWCIFASAVILAKKRSFALLRMTKSREAIIVLSCWSAAKHLNRFT